MKLGVFLMGTKDGSYSDVIEQVIAAEDLGFHGVWLAERYFANGDLLWPSPMVAASFLAANTKKIRIGLAARVLPFHHPLHVAADAATLDILSQGRLDLGLSRGSMDEAPHQAFGVPREEARLRFDEAFEVLCLAFRGQPFSYRGRYFDLRDIIPTPGCFQRPHPPLYMVANNPLSLDAAADLGLPVFMNGALDREALGRRMLRYRRRCGDAGFDPDSLDIPVNRFVFVGESRAHAHRVMREPFLRFLEHRAPDLRAFLAATYGPRAQSFDFLARNVAIFDDPQGCADRLQDLAEETGMNHALCTFNLSTLGHRECVDSMRLFATEVAPMLEQAEGASRGPGSCVPESMIRSKNERGADEPLALEVG